MENINNMAANSLESLSRENLSERGRRKLTREIVCGAVAVACLCVGLLCSRIFPSNPTLPALLYTIGFLVEGVPVFVAAVRGIVTRNLTNAMEILVALAIIACYFSQQLILAVLIPLILNVVHFLEERSIMGGRDVIEGLKKMQQTSALLIEGDSERRVDARTLKVGQLIAVLPGSGIPIDGEVISGESHIDQKSLTGEPEPAHVRPGVTVYAGTVNIDGRIVVRVDKEYVDTSFSQILKLLERSEGIAIPESRLIDRFMLYYIPFVLAVAAAVALIESDISRAIAILVVSCPCGQMLVSSAPMIAALSVATRRGILIKNSKFIEELTEIDAVVFDKTGTVTEGALFLNSCSTAEGQSEEALLRAALTLAEASTHPISRATVGYVGTRYAAYEDCRVRELSGRGMEGVLPDGRTLRFGNRAWLGECGVVVPEDAGQDAVGSVSYVACDGELLGCLCFGDRVRESAAGSISQLRELGVERTVMLTGDREAPAAQICAAVGIDTLHAQLLPQQKLDILHDIKQDYHVLAVGDGINDALALREADVGIAMGAMGSELAIQSADIALMNNRLENIPFAVGLARRTRRIVYQNLALSIGISAVMIALSAFGVISALAGSVLHNCGAFAVLINSSRILKLGEGANVPTKG